MSGIKYMLLDAIEQKKFAFSDNHDRSRLQLAKEEAYEQACDDISDLIRGILP